MPRGIKDLTKEQLNGMAPVHPSFEQPDKFVESLRKLSNSQLAEYISNYDRDGMSPVVREALVRLLRRTE